MRWNKPVEELAPLLSSAEAINSVDVDNGNRPLHIAAQNGHDAIVAYLVQNGAELDAQNGKGNTALHMAIEYDYYTCAKLILDAGADPSIANETGAAAGKGIEGTKCLSIVALISARTTEQLVFALKMCENNPAVVEKASLVGSGLKIKKALGSDIWTAEVQDLFKHVTSLVA